MSGYQFEAPWAREEEAVSSTQAPWSPRKKRLAALAGIVGVVAVVIWFNPFAGRTVYDPTELGLGMRSVSRFGYGSSKIYARAGQKIAVSCDVTINRRNLTLYVRRDNLFMPRPLGEPPLRTLYLEASQKAAFSVTAPESGFYRISIWDGSNHDNGYDVSWHVGG